MLQGLYRALNSHSQFLIRPVRHLDVHVGLAGGARIRLRKSYPISRRPYLIQHVRDDDTELKLVTTCPPAEHGEESHIILSKRYKSTDVFDSQRVHR